MSTLQNRIMAGIILTTILGSTAAYAATGNVESILSGLGTTKTEIQTLKEKEKSGETLTIQESSILQSVKSALTSAGFGKGQKGPMGFGPGKMMDDLTDAEKTALESMTDEQKQDFFDTKRVEIEAKMEAREIVIDKKLNDETLTDAEKVILEKIKNDRAEMKAKRAEQKAAFDDIKPILDKKRNGETLSSDEQSKLDEFQIQYPHPGKNGKHEKGMKGMKGHFKD